MFHFYYIKSFKNLSFFTKAIFVSPLIRFSDIFHLIESYQNIRLFGTREYLRLNQENLNSEKN